VSVCISVCVSCYGMALQQQPTVSSLWHDLGVCYYQMLKVVEGRWVKVVAGQCMEALRQAVKLAPGNHAHWNALGILSAHTGSTSSSNSSCISSTSSTSNTSSCISGHSHSSSNHSHCRVLLIVHCFIYQWISLHR